VGRGLPDGVRIVNHGSEAVYEYNVCGQVAASDANHPNHFMFTGPQFDKETGLYCYRAPVERGVQKASQVNRSSGDPFR